MEEESSAVENYGVVRHVRSESNSEDERWRIVLLP